MKQSLIVFLFASIVCLLAFGPKANDQVDNLIASLQRWTETNPQEKVYLHMDKPYYALGDTVWFKAYVTIGSRHQLSKMSGALYVELINEKDSLLTSVKLPVMAGMAMGDLVLGDEYKGGNFRIRAYTQWMRNAGEEYFFDHSFAVGDPLSLASDDKHVPGKNNAAKQDQAEPARPKPGPLAKSDVQFFPEGGSMVAGMNSRIGFKAVGIDGLGVAVKGIIVDDAGIEVSDLESLHAGMGVFNLRPEAGKSYKAKLIFGDGTEKTVDLPKALNQGYALSVYQPNADSVLVRINATPDQYQLSPAVGLVVHSGGETIFGSQIRISRAVNSVWLLKKDFPSGIAQFTLFDYTGQPLNERVAFIKSGDQLELELKTTKKSYKSRERVELELLAKDKMGRATSGNFSVSVIDESKVPSDENTESTIVSGLLLSSDIKGYIEQPNYYFSRETEEVNKALDNLMLTQGYRRFSWKDIENTTAAAKPLMFKAESLGTELSGRVLTLSGKPVVNGTVTVMSLTPGFMEQARTDTEGRFSYAPIMLADSLRFAVQAMTEKKSKKVEIVLDSVPLQVIGKNWNIPGFNTSIAASTAVYLENSKKQDDLLSRTGGTSRINRLKEVRVKARKSADLQYAAQGSLRIPEGHSDQTYFMERPGECPNLAICLVGKIVGLRSKAVMIQKIEYRDYPTMEVILNGRKLDSLETVDFWTGSLVDPADIGKIEAVRMSQPLMAMLGTGPCILVYTNAIKKQRYNPNVVNIKPKGFNKAREFYAPRYDRPSVSHQLPDLRSTIYWNAKVKTLESGRTTLSFFNADGPGIYKVIVEGINAAGELGRVVYRYEVEGGGAAIAAGEMPSPGTHELVNALQGMQQRMPAEKLYVHTDKPYYNLGDTIWFKAYLFDAATLSASRRSGLLYVELNDDSAEAVRRISIPIKDGTGYAQIPLPGKIFHEGGYTLRAYTNWMQNFGADYFFTKRFHLGVPSRDTWLVRASSVISKVADKDQLQADLVLSRPDGAYAGLREVEIRIMEGDKQLFKDKMQTSTEGKLDIKYALNQKSDGRNIRAEIRTIDKNDGNQRLLVPLNISRNQYIDVQFLPEGGNLVAGLKSVVGFKAIGEDGKGMHVSGEILDSKGSIVREFSSLYNGMGSFEFVPKPGETYRAMLKQPEQTGRPYELPAVKVEGLVMRIVNEEQNDSLMVQVLASADGIHPDSSYYLVATSRGVVTCVKALDLHKGKLNIAKDLFPTGITRFTLLRNKTVLNERRVFIDHQDQLKVTWNSNKTSYYKRDSVSLTLEVKDKNGNPVKGNFSVAVTDDNQVKADTAGYENISASLLLRSDLEGNIENPGYYLNKDNKERWQALDNLLLTQGWVGYDWKDVFKPAAPVAFAAEKYFKVSGSVENLTGKPVKGADILISSQKPFFITNTITDDKGQYVFENLPPVDSGSFFIQARTPKGGKMNFGEVKVNRFKAPVVNETFRDQILPWYLNSDVAQLNYVKNVTFKAEDRSLKQTGIALKEVKIKEKKIIKGSYNRAGPGNADLIFDEKDIRESGVMNLYQLLKQKLPGLHLTMEEGLPTLKLNNFMVVIEIDGGGLPLHMNESPTTDDLIEELNQFKIEGFVGMEVMYSRKYTNNYFPTEGLPDKFSMNEILSSQYSLRTASDLSLDIQKGLPLEDELQRPVPIYEDQPFYKTNYKERTGYLELRVNVKKNGTRDIAVIGITTKTDRGWFRINKPDVVSYRPLPVMRPQEFYSPKYALKSKDTAEPDLRSTVFWKPDIVTDANGRASISFYTTDVAGTYTLNLQGADMDGKTGSTNTKIKITNQEQ